MKILYIKDTYNSIHFTKNKIYNVSADYRQRNSKQVIQDNGFVVVDNLGQQNMILPDDCIITDNDASGVYIFK